MTEDVETGQANRIAYLQQMNEHMGLSLPHFHQHNFYELGYLNRSHFYTLFRDQYGVTPKQYRDIYRTEKHI